MSIDSATTFVIEVDGDDPRWKEIDPGRYHSCNPEFVVEHLPVLPGRWRVSCRLLEVGDAKLYEVLSVIDSQGFDHPNRAEIETLFDTFKRTELNVMGCCRQRRVLKWGQLHYPIIQHVDRRRHASLMAIHEYCYWVDYAIAVTNRVKIP